MLSFGIYWKQLLIFVLLLGAAGGGFWYVQFQQSSEASPKRTPLPNTPVASLSIALQDGGTAVVNGEPFSGLIRFESARQVFDYQAFQQDGSFVDQLTTTVTLPRDVDATQLVARHTGSFGVLTEEPIIVGNSITYVAGNLTPNATYRLELVMPPATLHPSLLGRLVDGLRNLSPAWWLGIALGLPTLALVVLSGMFAAALRTWRGPVVTQELDTPPTHNGQPVSPALVAILVGGKVSPRALAATLLHLAQRGFIQVVHHRDGFSFGKKRLVDLNPNGATPAGLAPFETILLEKIFTGEAIKSTDEDIQVRVGRHIFSRKIAQAYLAMYDTTVTMGWFVQSPQSIYRWYRSLALMVIAASIGGFLLSLMVGPEPYFYLLGWAGLFFVGLVMYQITPFLPRRTRVGDGEYHQWVAFRNYLTSARPMGAMAGAQALYERHLPYAVALGVEVEWTERFVGGPFHVPDWYSSADPIYVIEDFANNLFPIVGSVAIDFAKAREPHAV